LFLAPNPNRVLGLLEVEVSSPYARDECIPLVAIEGKHQPARILRIAHEKRVGLLSDFDTCCCAAEFALPPLRERVRVLHLFHPFLVEVAENQRPADLRTISGSTRSLLAGRPQFVHATPDEFRGPFLAERSCPYPVEQ
jgi:hypothetical protein